MFWILDFIVNGNFTLGFAFIVYIWIVFMLRWLYSLRYKPFTEEYYEPVSVIVPVYKENLKLFDNCLKSIYNEKPAEIMVVINGHDEYEKEYEKIAKKYKATVYNLDKAAKRPAIVLGVKKAKNDILLLLDSDTVLKKGALKELLKAFKDPKVGGATTTQKIINADKTIVRKFAGWMEDIRFAISQKAQSSFGAVGCLPGRAIAFRKSIIEDSLDDFLNERFMGQLCTSGDDRFLTSVVLKKGYKTVLQSTAEVYTNCPDTFGGFLKQQLRWARSSRRETLMNFKWLWKKPFTFFSYISDIITPFFFFAVEINVIWQLVVYGGRFVNVGQFIFDTIFALFAMNLSIGLKQLHHLKINPDDIKFLPLYSLFMTLVMTPIGIIGFFTMADQSWMSRNVVWSDGTKESLVSPKVKVASD